MKVGRTVYKMWPRLCLRVSRYSYYALRGVGKLGNYIDILKIMKHVFLTNTLNTNFYGFNFKNDYFKAAGLNFPNNPSK